MQLSVSSPAFNPAMVTPPGSRSPGKSLKMSLRKLTYFISFFACTNFPFQVFSLKFAINESQRNFAKLIPYLKADKLIMASFAYCFPYEVTQNGADGNSITQTAAGTVS